MLIHFKKNLCVLVGRESKHKRNETGKSESSLSDKNKGDENDDDSPYFLRITIDEEFLAELEEPMLTEPKELEGPPCLLDLMVSTKAFKSLISKELDKMFGDQDGEE